MRTQHKLDGVFSNMFGKSASAIISHLLEYPGESFDVAPFMSKRSKASPQEVQNALVKLVNTSSHC